MVVVAVVAHARKSLQGGLPELRQTLARQGCTAPIWHEVTKSRKAGPCVRAALADGAKVIFVWGGDGMVQRCVDAVAATEGASAALALVPAGTANLLAANLGVPRDIVSAVGVGLYGKPVPIDLGSVNGEHFAVMAGAGFDAEMIKRADRMMKQRAGRVAYAIAGAASMRVKPVSATIKVDGEHFYRGTVSCVLIGNVSKLIGGIAAFPRARPNDGTLDVGLITASNPFQWATVFCRLVTGTARKSKYVRLTSGKKLTIRFAQPVRYQLDGGARASATRLKVRVLPAAVAVCVPR